LARSLSHPIPLNRNDVALLPVTNERVFEEEVIRGSDGMPVIVTAVVVNGLNEQLRPVQETFIITEDGAVPAEELYNRGSFQRIEVNYDTGARKEGESLVAGGQMFRDEFDIYEGTGVRIFEGVEIRRASEINTSKFGVDLTAYTQIFKDQRYTWSLAWTAMLTVACAFWSVFITALCAYPLTYDHLKGRKFLNTFIILTMYFNAGTIPTYILLNNLGLINHPLVLALPFCLSVFNMIIMRSYFYGIPISLRESAELDGAGPIRTLVFIYVPLSMPVIATLLLFYAVGRWNGYSDALMFMNQNERFYPIQLLLYNMLAGRITPEVALQEASTQMGAAESLRMAMVMFAMVPILVVYPFLQRYFIAGVTLGAVKE